MQITKKDLKQLINEEVERISNEEDKFDVLLETYAADYESDSETVSKQALIDFLEVLEESKIPLSAFEAFMENMPEDSVTSILSEVVDLEEKK